MRKFARLLTGIMLASAALTGCDGKDPERFQRVARKIGEKSRKATEDVNLPRITITMPDQANPKVDDQARSGKIEAPVGALPNKE